jgi:hypothetical protein
MNQMGAMGGPAEAPVRIYLSVVNTSLIFGAVFASAHVIQLRGVLIFTSET